MFGDKAAICSGPGPTYLKRAIIVDIHFCITLVFFMDFFASMIDAPNLVFSKPHGERTSILLRTKQLALLVAFFGVGSQFDARLKRYPTFEAERAPLIELC